MQAEGLIHIRNLKQGAAAIWECYGYEDEYWPQCILIAMKNHRLFLSEKRKEEEKTKYEKVESLWNSGFVD